MSTRFPLSVALLIGAALLAGCGTKSPDDSKVLAHVNKEAVTEAEYKNYVSVLENSGRTFPNKEMEKQVVMDEITSRILLAQGAVDQKVDREPDVYLQLRLQHENLLARAMMRKYLKDNPISDEEVQKRFQELSEKADKNQYRVRHILVRTEEEAREILAQLKKGANFANLAKQKSIDVGSGRQGGELPGWFNQDQVVPAFYEAVRKLNKGEMTAEPVKTDYGWHIIKLEGVQPRTMPTFEESKGSIRQIIQQERIATLVKSLKDKASIKIEK